MSLAFLADYRIEQFSTLCTIFADTTQVKKEKKQRGGSTYYTLDFKVVLLCGMTEFKAQISWMEDVSRRQYYQGVITLKSAMIGQREAVRQKNSDDMDSLFILTLSRGPAKIVYDDDTEALA